jgi:hypothetical protein
MVPNKSKFIPGKKTIIIVFAALIIITIIVLLSIAGANYAKCGEFKLKCSSESLSEQLLDELQEDNIKEDEEEMAKMAEGKMCNFVNIKDVEPSPDKDGDNNFDADESVPCEKCSEYKLNGVKMTPFISDEDGELGYCRASLVD